MFVKRYYKATCGDEKGTLGIDWIRRTVLDNL
jgi:hypothetical protein